MSGLVSLLQGAWAAAEGFAMRAPEAAGSLAAGSWPAEVLAASAGLALLVAGARLGRFLACAGGALIGWVGGGLLAPQLHAWLPGWLPPWVGAAMLGFGSLLAPWLYPLSLGLLPGVLLGLRAPVAGRNWLGGTAGGLALGLLALWLRRLVLAATAALAGAVLVSLALVAASRQIPALETLARRPALLLGLAATLVVAGTAYQFGAGVERGGRGGPRPGKLEGVEGR
jgi:hypothetical protein